MRRGVVIRKLSANCLSCTKCVSSAETSWRRSIGLPPTWFRSNPRRAGSRSRKTKGKSQLLRKPKEARKQPRRRRSNLPPRLPMQNLLPLSKRQGSEKPDRSSGRCRHCTATRSPPPASFAAMCSACSVAPVKTMASPS